MPLASHPSSSSLTDEATARDILTTTSWLPEAWPIWRAVISGLCAVGRFDVALLLCLMWCTFARPIELMALKPDHLHAPSRVATYWTPHLNPEVEGVPSKAEEFDVTTSPLRKFCQSAVLPAWRRGPSTTQTMALSPRKRGDVRRPRSAAGPQRNVLLTHCSAQVSGGTALSS
ncbi:unnamed protein product [Prorocentrum cordatum]|uniref:Uncharacterized protein n=1 Tax=Prorocentrum cordatum TaxID=2364126 RepID=A0ABN9TZF9_9DINO|nr:unnamed protein product [Polarella glacialis]